MNLAINTDSFHCRYYCWVRSVWGFDGEKKQTSLCPYVQTMLWGSIFCILFSPCLIAGWLYMKIGRRITLIESAGFDKFLVWFGKKFTILDSLDRGPERFSESPIAAGIAFTMTGSVIAICLASIVITVVCVLALLGVGIWNIGSVASAVVYALAHIGWATTLGFCWAGLLFVTIWQGAVWLFTNGALWWFIGSWIVYGFSSILVLGLSSVSLCLIVMWASKLSFVKRIGKYLLNKFNGFSEAKTARTERLKEAERLKTEPWACLRCGYRNGNFVHCRECGGAKPAVPSLLWPVLNFVLFPVVWPLEKCMSVYEIVKNKQINIMGPFAIIWEYLVAIKKGVCPIVEFVNMDTIRAKQREGARERMEAEDASRNDN